MGGNADWLAGMVLGDDRVMGWYPTSSPPSPKKCSSEPSSTFTAYNEKSLDHGSYSTRPFPSSGQLERRAEDDKSSKYETQSPRLAV